MSVNLAPDYLSQCVTCALWLKVSVCLCCYVYLSVCLSVQSVDASYVADVYDELLTQAEIQGNINKVNGNCYSLLSLSELVLVCHGSQRHVECIMYVNMTLVIVLFHMV